MRAQTWLTRPTAVTDLQEQIRPDGWVEIHGYATFQGERVHIGRARPSGLVGVDGPLALQNVPGFRGDAHTGGASGDVQFDSLERFWLIRTTHQDGVDSAAPLPGLTTVIDGVEFGVTDTCGTVSLQGVRQLQLIWLGSDAPGDAGPEGAGWVLDGYGCWTTLVDRSLVAEVRYVEWKAIWRDITVFVAGVRDSRAHIFVTDGGVPDFEAPEIRHTGGLNNCWSAEVPVAELSLRSWRSVEHPLGDGVVAGVVGFVRGRTTVLIRPKSLDGSEQGIAAIRKRGQTVTPDYVMHPRLKNADRPPVEWLASVPESDITDLRRISSTTVWNGEVTPVDGVGEVQDTVFFTRVTADRPDTTELECAAESVGPDDLPAKALALAGFYEYTELRP